MDRDSLLFRFALIWLAIVPVVLAFQILGLKAETPSPAGDAT
jgi:hypothetical protein